MRNVTKIGENFHATGNRCKRGSGGHLVSFEYCKNNKTVFQYDLVLSKISANNRTKIRGP